LGGGSENLIIHTLKGEGFDASEDGTGRGEPLVPIAFGSKDHGADAGETCPTLRAGGHADSHPNAGVPPAVVIPIDMRQCSRGEKMTNNQDPEKASGGPAGLGIGDNGDPAPTIGTSHQPAVAVQRERERESRHADDRRDVGHEGQPSGRRLDGASHRPIAFGWQNSAAQGDSVSEDVTPSLDKSKVPAIAVPEQQIFDMRGNGSGGGKPHLNAKRCGEPKRLRADGLPAEQPLGGQIDQR
jgi:hypothetical protein